MDILGNNIKLVPMGIAIVCIAVTSLFTLNPQTDLFIVLFSLFLVVTFSVWYLSKKDRRDSYKRSTIKSKAVTLIASLVMVVGLYLYFHLTK